jgi:cation:H+ antiporter
MLMTILLNLVLLVIGFVALIKGADYFVEGSAAVAKKFNIPGVIIGLTIVAMGTSAPELAVSISAGLSGSNEIAISNVIGSNIFNLMVVLGVCCILSPVAVDKGIMKRDFPFSIAIAVLGLVLISENLYFGRKMLMPGTGKPVSGNLSRFDGILLIILFAALCVVLLL